MFISVVVPAYNEEAVLGDCLRALREQDYDGPFEIIVADNASTDGTSSVALQWGARVVRESRRGIAYARQAGCAAARGVILAGTDADTVVPRYWLSSIARRFRQHTDATVVAGYFLLRDGPAPARALTRLGDMLSPALARCMPSAWNFCGNNYAVRADAFRAVGGFDVALRYGEDVDLCLRLRRLGRVVYAPEMRVVTSGRGYMRSLWRSTGVYCTDYVWRILSHQLRLDRFAGRRGRVLRLSGLAMAGAALMTASLWATGSAPLPPPRVPTASESSPRQVVTTEEVARIWETYQSRLSRLSSFLSPVPKRQG